MCVCGFAGMWTHSAVLCKNTVYACICDMFCVYRVCPVDVCAMCLCHMRVYATDCVWLLCVQACDEVILGNIPVSSEDEVAELVAKAMTVDLMEEMPDSTEGLIEVGGLCLCVYGCVCVNVAMLCVLLFAWSPVCVCVCVCVC